LKTTSSQRRARWGALLLLMALPAVPAHARVHHSENWARDRFASAERMREALNGRPPADRTRHDYQRVINAYRNVYFGAPTSTKADPSVVAVAETLVEMGRRFDDDKILNEAISQYKFLRREYPGSKYRCDALFTIGEIYKDDLDDPDQARTVFQEFLHRYPHNRLVEDAQQAIAELDRDAEAEKKAEAQKGKAGAEKNKTAKDSTGKSADSQAEAGGQEAGDRRAGHLPRVTGIRHWSTPDYTRVAIDVESEVRFASQRIASPDRIFFDLRDTKLASTLVGKSFDVDDGFLKKIRVAQFQPGRTRVVLEVDDLSDYEAFLLPNPYRLIIDIHGKDIHGKNAKAKAKEADSLAASDVEATPKSGSKSDGPSAAQASSAEAASELKADLRAAGKAPVTSEDVSDETRIVARSEAADSKPHSATSRTATSAGGKAAAPPVKKVVVEADDDDDSPPVRPAKSDTQAGHKRPVQAPAASAQSDSSADSDSSSPAKSAMDEAVDSPGHGKTSSRLASNRKATDLDIHEARPTSS
jgi:N-acetylmuramoyl-L-alanine amidase